MDKLDQSATSKYTIYSDCAAFSNCGKTNRTDLPLKYVDARGDYPTVDIQYERYNVDGYYKFYITFSKKFLTDGIYALKMNYALNGNTSVMEKKSAESDAWTIGLAAGYHLKLSGPSASTNGITYTLTPKNTTEFTTKIYCAEMIDSTMNLRLSRGYLYSGNYMEMNTIQTITPTLK